MSVQKYLRKALKAPLNWALQMPIVRSKVIFELKQKHYAELDLEIPLNYGLRCPISSFEYWYSFGEVFLDAEYEAAWACMPVPTKWLDIGCHAGFFSLSVVRSRAKLHLSSDYSALLIDADSRVRLAVQKLINLNEIGNKLTFKHGALSAKTGSIEFRERGFMSSSADELGENKGPVRKVPVISEEQIMELFTPPYDLVKIDIEGSEFDFMRAYGKILKSSTHLIIEWHSWGGSEEQIREAAEIVGFRLLLEMVPARPVQHSGRSARCGVLLFKKSDGIPKILKSKQDV